VTAGQGDLERTPANGLASNVSQVRHADSPCTGPGAIPDRSARRAGCHQLDPGRHLAGPRGAIRPAAGYRGPPPGIRGMRLDPDGQARLGYGLSRYDDPARVAGRGGDHRQDARDRAQVAASGSSR
jgi:hypothetical protein